MRRGAGCFFVAVTHLHGRQCCLLGGEAGKAGNKQGEEPHSLLEEEPPVYFPACSESASVCVVLST